MEKILIVDDDVQFLEATEYMLKYENYTVITAKNGEDAIIKYKESKPDIVFSLPFNIPVYGDGVAILPLLMGVTLFLTMRMSSATMDKNQKPVMYFMNGMTL